MNLKQKTISGLIWSFIGTFTGFGIQFIVSIILARLLSPREFGLIGMIVIFIAISQTFIDSGFSSALIRKKDCTENDYSTVFYFNMAIGIILFLCLFFAASSISNFFNEAELKNIVQVLSLVLIINSATIIQRTILTKRINFKLQARISIIASIGSGGIGITMALLKFGVWSLVAQQMSQQILISFFLWFWNRWKPLLVFSKKSFKELFGFGGKLLISSILDTVYRNIYYIIIGKYFSAVELGFYTRAEQFNNLPSQNLNEVIGRVTYPVLSSIQDDIPRLRSNYRKLIRSTMFITFILMLGMASAARPMVLTLIGHKWLPSVIYLQMLCFVGMFYPLHALNLNILKVRGRSDLFLKLEIIKKILAIPTILIGVFWGIKIMIMGMIVNSFISYYINSYWSGKLIGYPLKKQVLDILPSLALALTMSAFTFSLSFLVGITPQILLLLQILAGALFIVVISETFKIKDYLFIKELVFEKLLSKKPIRHNEKTK